MSGVRDSNTLQAASPSMRVFVLGEFRVVVDGKTLSDKAWRRPQSRRLFKYLVTRRFRRALKEAAMELFWPESEPTAAATNLRSLMFGMRQALREIGAEGVLAGDRDSLVLDWPGGIWVDADTFDDLVSKARTADDPLPLLEAASELYKGDFLAEDEFEEWTAERRDAQRLTWQDVQFQLAQRYEQRGDAERALACLLDLLLVDRTNERAAQQAILLLVQLGRRPEALRVFSALQAALQEELGVAASQRTLELQQLATRVETPTNLTRLAQFRCAYSFPQPRQLIDRIQELARLQRLVYRGPASGQAVLISAPAGTGKSALLGAIVRSAQDHGVLCLVGGSYDQRSAVPLVAFEEAFTDYILSMPRESSDASLASAADELVSVRAELRQHLGLDSSAQTDVSGARMRLFGAVLSFVRSVAARGPVLLGLEDLHAADAASLQLVHFLVRQTRHSPVTIVGTFRDDEVRPGEPLAQLVSSLEREGIADHLRLQPLSEQATGKLAAVLAGSPVSETARRALHDLTSGNPLFIEQVLLTIGSNGHLDQLVNVGQQIIGQGANVPLIIRELIARRLVDMSPPVRATMEIAAVLGSTFDEATLLAVAEPIDEPTLLGHLDEAIRAQILRETPTGYAFQHALLREGVYWSLTRPRRTLLHRRAAEVLERLARGRTGERASELAYHYNLAGQSAATRGKAFQYSLLAARQTQALTAYRESVGHFTRASALLDLGVDADLNARIEVLVGRGEAQQEVGHWVDSLRTWEQVLELSQDPLQRARTRANMAYVHVELGRMDESFDDVQAGLEDLRDSVGPEAARFRIELQQWSAYVLYIRGRYYETLELGQHMLAEASLLASARPLFVARNVLGWALMGLGRSAEALEQYGLMLEASELSGHKLHQAFARQHIGHQQYLAGNFDAAEDQLQAARQIYYDSANEIRALHLMQHQALVSLARGQLSRAHDHASLSLELSQASQVRWASDSHHILGLIAALRGQWQEAEGCFKRALALRLNLSVMDDAVESTIALARVYEDSGDWASAFEQCLEGVRLARAMDAGPMLVQALTSLGRLHLRGGELSLAAQLITEAVELAETIPDTLENAPALLASAELHLVEGRPDAARKVIEGVLSRELPVEQSFSAHWLLARSYAALGDAEAAAAHATHAVQLADALGSPHLASAAALAQGWVEAVRGELDTAWQAFQRAEQLADAAQAPYYVALALEAQVNEQARHGAAGPSERSLKRLLQLRQLLGPRHRDEPVATLAIDSAI